MRMALAGVSLVLSMVGFACGAGSTHTIGFWYEADAFMLPPDLVSRLGAPISATEMQSIEQVSRTEIQQAFSDLRVTFTANDDAFWRVNVVRSLSVRSNRQAPAAGESLPLGFLGGVGSVGFDIVAAKATDYAPPDAARPVVIEAIGRGVGRVAVHEFIHQILGTPFADDYRDADTYEYGSPDRRSQYYGDLHWGAAWPLLREKIGTRTAR